MNTGAVLIVVALCAIACNAQFFNFGDFFGGGQQQQQQQQQQQDTHSNSGNRATDSLRLSALLFFYACILHVF